MSMELIKKIFLAMPEYDAWSVQLLKIKTSKRNGTSYLCRELIFTPENKMKDFVAEVSSRYIKEEKGDIYSFTGITEYDGSTISNTIYKLQIDNILIKDDCSLLIEAIGNPEVEIDPLELRAQAYLLRGIVKIDDEEHSVKLVSMQNPVTTLKHKFLRANGVFKEIEDKVISLRTSIDVMIYDDAVYMFTLAGEKLFDLERSYRATCSQKIEEIGNSNILNDIDSFSLIAGQGHNPRKFVSFNDSHFQKLKNANSRRKMAEKFKIPLDGDKFDTTQDGAVDKIVKLLCDRAMVDPFDEYPMEVAGSKKWE